MHDISILTGINVGESAAKNANIRQYYLQQIGIDIWKIRDKKLVFLIEKSSSKSSFTSSADKLFLKMLQSVGLSLKNVELLFVESDFDINSLGLSKYNAIVVMSKNLFSNICIKGDEDNKYYNNQPIFYIANPEHLLTNSPEKKLAYLTLLRLSNIFK